MNTPKPETPIYTMPVDELLDVLGATRRTTPRRTKTKGERRRQPRTPVTPPREQPKTDV